MSRPLAPHVARMVAAARGPATQGSAAQGSSAQGKPAAPPARPLAPHVARAIGRPAPQAPAQPAGLAPHVAAALARARAAPGPPRSAAQPAGLRPLAPHVARAVAGAAGRRPALQPYGWAIHYGQEPEGQEIVDQNLVRARGGYIGWETTTDPELVERPRQPILLEGEAIHLHAHGHESALAGFTPASLARELVRKFQARGLAGRTIVLHSCETGQETFPEDLLTHLLTLAEQRGVDLAGTTVFAPIRALVVEGNGQSRVAKEGEDPSDLRVEQGRGARLMAFGQGWRGWRVNAYGVVQEIGGHQVPGRVTEVLNQQHAQREIEYYDVDDQEVVLPEDWQTHYPDLTAEEALANLRWQAEETRTPRPMQEAIPRFQRGGHTVGPIGLPEGAT
ncbi:MAG: hypothetical protein U0002_17830 [Thermoanaerobaculia bacterium]